MKKIYLYITLLLSTLSVSAQAPFKISFQANVLNTSNLAIVNQNVGVKISILSASENANVLYSETQNCQTNNNGFIAFEIGSGANQTHSLSSIDWAAGDLIIKTEIDPEGGSNYTIVGTSKLLNVPLALYANRADTITSLTPEILRAKSSELNLQSQIDFLKKQQIELSNQIQLLLK